MTTTINASTTAGLVSTADLSGSLALQTANTTAVTIDTSQNVGIGTSSPAKKLDVVTTATDDGVQVTGGATGANLFLNNTGTSGRKYRIYSTGSSNAVGAGFLGFYDETASSFRMGIDSSGNLLVGRTSTVTNPASSGAIVYASSGYSTTDGTTTANYTKDRIYFNATNYYVLNGSSTGVVLPSGNTSWSAQSDERTKDIIEPIQNATQKLSDFRCVIGKYKTDDSNKRRVFLIAQDVQKVLPEAVTELDDENKTLALSYTDVIPLLVASIKELKAINDQQAETINALTARVVALESK